MKYFIALFILLCSACVTPRLYEIPMCSALVEVWEDAQYADVIECPGPAMPRFYCAQAKLSSGNLAMFIYTDDQNIDIAVTAVLGMHLEAPCYMPDGKVGYAGYNVLTKVQPNKKAPPDPKLKTDSCAPNGASLSCDGVDR
jgi:hypothetical protein